MKKLHIEFDLIASDKTATDIKDAFEVCLTDNILEALEAHLDDMKVRVFTLDCHAEGMD